MVAEHFTPTYDPWDQRLCAVPGGDLFKSIKAGDAEVVTDTIESFVPEGIRLTSGRVLEADVVVTATGLQLLAFGGIEPHVDGERVELSEQFVWQGAMITGVPNFAVCIGYTNASWTLRADLTHRLVCKVLNWMDREGHAAVVPAAGRGARRAAAARPGLRLRAALDRRLPAPGGPGAVAGAAELRARLADHHAHHDLAARPCSRRRAPRCGAAEKVGLMTRTMRAQRLDTRTLTFEVTDVPVPEPGPGEVLIKVAFCGICHSDLCLLDGTFPAMGPAVITQGHEASGTIAALGGRRRRLGGRRPRRPGRRSPVRHVRYCRAADYGHCTALQLMAFAYDGAWAEYTVAQALGLTRIPDNVSMEQAAILADAVSTPYGAVVHTADLRVGESVGVWGAGGVGTHVVQLARLVGATPIVAVDLDETVRQRALDLGADLALDSRDPELPAKIREITGGLGLDAAFDAVGLGVTFEQALASLGNGGRLVGVGMSAEELGLGIEHDVQPQPQAGPRPPRLRGRRHRRARPPGLHRPPRPVPLHQRHRVARGRRRGHPPPPRARRQPRPDPRPALRHARSSWFRGSSLALLAPQPAQAAAG